MVGSFVQPGFVGGRGPGKIEVIMFFSRGAIFRVSLCFWQAVGSPVQSAA